MIKMLNTGITRLYLIKGTQGYILLDTGLHMTRDKFESLFKEAQILPSEIQLIVISHAHPDHYSGLQALKEICSAPVLAHRAALETLQTGKIKTVHPRNECGERFKNSIRREALPRHTPYTPEIIIDCDYDLSSYGIEGALVLTPGHSDCCLSLLLKTGEAFINDIFTTSPYTGKTDVALVVSDEKVLFESIRFLIKKSTLFYAAHGGPYTRDEIIELLKTKYPHEWKEV